MLRQIKVTELCKELEEKLVGLQYSEDSLRRYRKVFREFEEYAGDCDYSQSRGTDFLLWKFKQLGGFVTSGEHSKNEMYYFRVIRSLAEYYNFGTLFRRHDYDGEIVWPLPFKEVTEGFLQYEVEYGCSQCHYRRCRGIIKDLILFLDSSGIHHLNGVTADLMSRFTETMIGLAPVTIAERLSALRQYFKYAFRYIQMQAPEHMFQCQQVLGIPYKKTSRRQVGYLSEAETKTLLSMPDTKTRKGRRDQALLTLLYDSGARVQELADLRVGDLRLEFPAQVKLTGKGRKTRSVPLMDKTTALLKNYLLEQHLDSPSDFEHPLFYNSQGRKLTRQGIAYILKKYAVACEIEEISPHKIRHTKAMHLTEADVNPIFIRDFLGHTDLKVTEVYSKTSIKMKKAALDKMKPGKDVLPDKPIKDWTEDKSLLDWLNGLMH